MSESTPQTDRWELPAEPEVGTVVAGSSGVYRRDPERGWRRTDSTNRLGWHQVLTDAPLVRLVPARSQAEPPLAAVDDYGPDPDEERLDTEYRPGFYRLRGTLGPAIPGTLVFIIPSDTPRLWNVYLPDGRGTTRSESSLDCAGAERVEL